MTELYEFLVQFSDYIGLIRTAIVFVVLGIVAVVVANALRHLRQQMDEQRVEKLRDDNLKNIDYDTLDRREKATTLRNVISADSIDVGPNSYMVVSDGGQNVYIRSFTITSIPRRAKFANTFAPLMNFQNCESSIFIKPIAEDEMLRKYNKHINVLVGESYEAEKNSNVNRVRDISGQIQDANDFAAQIESGENKFFSVGFLFTLHATDIKELNKLTQEFHSKALERNINISCCYGVQAEAFANNAPFNKLVKVDSSTIKSDAVKFFNFDKYSVSALYNYTQSSFSHKKGVPLGRDMFTAMPIIYDSFDGSHDGYTIVVAGKTGTGKSALVKMMVCRQVLMGYHFVSIDFKQRKGTSEGEYASLATLCDGVNFQISNMSSDVMNIFDISETTRYVKDSADIRHEVRSLDLTDKITMVTNIILKLVAGDDDQNVTTSLTENKYLENIVIENLKALYKSFGFIDGDADSLYTTLGSANASDSAILSDGRVLKKIPTMTDFYKQLLISRRDNRDANMGDAYNILIMSLANYVKELYYSERTCRFFTAEQFKALPYSESIKCREYKNEMNVKEAVKEVRGIRAYFDGQSSVRINKDCPFTNIDISLLSDSEKKLVQQIALEFVNENFIKKNSLSLDANSKMQVIVDEAHEMFKNQYDRAVLNAVSRTARSRNVSLMLISQTVSEYARFPETQDILKQATTKFILKQDAQDRDFLIDNINLTPAQASLIVDTLGGNPDDESDSNRHRGEVCIVDNKTVAFCKVDYRKETEQLAVATDAKGIEEAFAKMSA
ncbi:VirB4 family type IV secretion system protein [Butyrivibrio proteoclasticus]|uniref:VirB4 family type IV secretion system protein n=1 Tax=Butyrivibrio proteoclasticus TaxID=43305 RepID=UPI00047BE89D|nr:hypothetical protein [Butyrivibrio proteoclasticus]